MYHTYMYAKKYMATKWDEYIETDIVFHEHSEGTNTFMYDTTDTV